MSILFGKSIATPQILAKSAAKKGEMALNFM